MAVGAGVGTRVGVGVAVGAGVGTGVGVGVAVGSGVGAGVGTGLTDRPQLNRIEEMLVEEEKTPESGY